MRARVASLTASAWCPSAVAQSASTCAQTACVAASASCPSGGSSSARARSRSERCGEDPALSSASTISGSETPGRSERERTSTACAARPLESRKRAYAPPKAATSGASWVCVQRAPGSTTSANARSPSATASCNAAAQSSRSRSPLPSWFRLATTRLCASRNRPVRKSSKAS